MRTLKYAILGLLCDRSMTGYDLCREFKETVNEFWSAKHSQIYPELKKLTQEGKLTYRIEIAGTVLEKKVYTITEEGKKDFKEWLCALDEMWATPKDVFRLRTFFIHDMPLQKREAFLKDGLGQHEKRLEHLKCNQKKFTEIPKADDLAFGDYLVLLGAIMREETTCQWIRECMRLCREKEPYVEEQMKYKFYGWETADVPAVSEEYPGITTPKALYDALTKVWCADTCAPRMRKNWSHENLTLGQCSITAFLAQDIFGGKVYGISRPGGNYHCYNVVGDCKFDLTSEQFDVAGEGPLDYENNQEQFREVHFAKEEKRLRYEQLKELLKKELLKENACK